jgi:hypothetical protein
MFPSQQAAGTLSGSKSLQTIHKKYSDIFSPLDFNPPKRGSISSSDYSADLEPPSISTREESVLTVDTWLESEKHPSPTFLHTSPTTEYTAQSSWIDMEVDDMSPVTTRRRSSMTDFPGYIQHLISSTEVDNPRTMSLRSQINNGPEVTMVPINANLPACTAKIPKRRSSLKHQEAFVAARQSAEHFNEEAVYSGFPGITSPEPQDTDVHFTLKNNWSTSSQNHQVHSMLEARMSSISQESEIGKGPAIASAEVGFNTWLESDMAYFRCEGQLLPRPLPPDLLETLQFVVTNFPEPMLMCSSLLIETIRERFQKVRYNAEGPGLDDLTMPISQLNNQQQTKPSRWKWLGSSTNMKEQQTEPNIPLPSIKREWVVMRKVFPQGSDGLCEALYAYVLAYNYITSQCWRHTLNNTTNLLRPTLPWARAQCGTRPGTSRSDISVEHDMFGSASPRPSMSSEANGISRKAASILGMGEEGISAPVPPTNSNQPPSGDNVTRSSTFTSLRGVPSFFFGGMGQGQQRQSESRDSTTRPNTAAERAISFTRPTTPASRGGISPITFLGQRGPDQGEQLAELRRGLAKCCARLVITLHRASSGNTQRKDDKDSKVDPSFMRSLCENVRVTEEAMGRCP